MSNPTETLFAYPKTLELSHRYGYRQDWRCLSLPSKKSLRASCWVWPVNFGCAGKLPGWRMSSYRRQGRSQFVWQRSSPRRWARWWDWLNPWWLQKLNVCCMPRTGFGPSCLNSLARPERALRWTGVERRVAQLKSWSQIGRIDAWLG